MVQTYVFLLLADVFLGFGLEVYIYNVADPRFVWSLAKYIVVLNSFFMRLSSVVNIFSVFSPLCWGLRRTRSGFAGCMALLRPYGRVRMRFVDRFLRQLLRLKYGNICLGRTSSLFFSKNITYRRFYQILLLKNASKLIILYRESAIPDYLTEFFRLMRLAGGFCARSGISHYIQKDARPLMCRASFCM